MKNVDKPRFAQIMLGMVDNFRDTITKEGMNMRFDMLKEYPIAHIEAASRNILRHRRYTKMPPIAEFIEALEGSTKTKAMAAWGVVMKALREGADPPEDPKIRETIKRIGEWEWLMLQTFDELHWIEKRFVEHYNGMDEKNIPLLVDHKVAGLLDNIGG